MKRTARILLGLFLCTLFASTHVFAGTSLGEDLYERAGLERLEELVPPELAGREGLLAVLKDPSLGSRPIASEVLGRLIASFRTNVLSEIGLFSSVLLLLLAAMYFAAMRHAWMRDTVGDAVEFVCVLALSVVSYKALFASFSALKTTLGAISVFMGGLLPVTGAVYSLSGGVVTATVQSGVLLVALSVLDAVTVTYLMPLLAVNLALTAAGAVSAVDLSGVCRFLRRAVTFALGGVFLLLLAILSVQTVLAAASDRLTLRSARFAAANFIPAVGGMFSEASKTVFAALGVLRTSLGGVAIAVLLWYLGAPLLALLIKRALFSLLSAAAQAFGLEREGRFLNDCGESIGLCLGILFSVGIFFVLALGVFLCIPIGG